MGEFIRKYLGINDLDRYIRRVNKDNNRSINELTERIKDIENIEPKIKKGEYIKIADNRLICLDVKFKEYIPDGYEEIIKSGDKLIGKVPVFEIPNTIYGGNWVEITNKKERDFFNGLLK